MTGKQLMQELSQKRQPEHVFIKWWRKENDFADYQLLDDFLAVLESGQDFGGYQLLDMEQMWATLERHGHGMVSREHRTSGDHLIWKHQDASGELTCDDYPLTPRNLISVFDGETRGDVIC